MDIRGWDNESCRSVATVTWSTGSTNVYRLGYKGCVDLCYVEEAKSGTYYKEHLPLLGQPVMTIPDNGNVSATSGVTNATSSPHHLTFNVGDRVKVLLEVDTLKEMQDSGHGGWNPRMAECIGKVFSEYHLLYSLKTSAHVKDNMLKITRVSSIPRDSRKSCLWNV